MGRSRWWAARPNLGGWCRRRFGDLRANMVGAPTRTWQCESNDEDDLGGDASTAKNSSGKKLRQHTIHSTKFGEMESILGETDLRIRERWTKHRKGHRRLDLYSVREKGFERRTAHCCVGHEHGNKSLAQGRNEREGKALTGGTSGQRKKRKGKGWVAAWAGACRKGKRKNGPG